MGARYSHHRKTGASTAIIQSLNICWEYLEKEDRDRILKESHEATYNQYEWEAFRNSKEFEMI